MRPQRKGLKTSYFYPKTEHSGKGLEFPDFFFLGGGGPHQHFSQYWGRGVKLLKEGKWFFNSTHGLLSLFQHASIQFLLKLWQEAARGTEGKGSERHRWSRDVSSGRCAKVASTGDRLPLIIAAPFPGVSARWREIGGGNGLHPRAIKARKWPNYVKSGYVHLPAFSF